MYKIFVFKFSETYFDGEQSYYCYGALNGKNELYKYKLFANYFNFKS